MLFWILFTFRYALIKQIVGPMLYGPGYRLRLVGGYLG